jgi:hypothetical protein
MRNPISIENLHSAIVEIRGMKVLLDTDVARIYGVETKRINEAVRNNPEKFPQGYILELSAGEWAALKSKFSSSFKGGKVKPPTAFPEKGLYMNSNVFNTETRPRVWSSWTAVSSPRRVSLAGASEFKHRLN